MSELDPAVPMTEVPEVITSPPAKTAGEEDHSDPDVFRGEPADPPTND